ncbi:MAG: bifunctional diaminohydroxyphosphoribosylaminopyrimidine deaminase/5-amino-6-(5-phosphoribosylamino)uracil reductase RibD [Corynebacterium sp.]|uniref:bifunctional diaminohydroxyphosphoribosylaminopyrimidine deaminase/5-amino-6-(5-phosphoribosylamino)uracil reductase RibD n=1 Tax=Corynebacterium sp. TaxID=1720 RepID=UPI0026E0BDCA|nr:bifunctional diaminohydroxyphosphoribosylaminopyrimidine deaminase/5-amino-6-(5-phosphoribosylamino)uracil reductase RibD [Corynebacterium sp.]MDO5669590.1 bifunctional diaminohydroxyphosphoribosylaminopyrimidine deaminase/5-amino-6-(5-phosphoribosylamino)uracil reductase RibD [Corynebacterium sp.]
MDIIARALATALECGEGARGYTSPNPPVGAAILDRNGELVGRGATQPAGGPHAEIMALREAGESAAGGTAVVTLEPCNHQGRTGPCAQALDDAGVDTVYYCQPDPNPVATGGAAFLRERGIGAECLDIEVAALIPWLMAVRNNRPSVTLKFAQTLDGFTAALDGTSQWITGEVARSHVHRDRSKRDAIIVGTGTAIADNPSLTARDGERELPTQPRRVVIGGRSLTGNATNLHRLGFEQYRGIPDALWQLWETGARDVLVEGGAQLASGFLQAGLVDHIQAYIAPTLLGQGRGVLAEAVGLNINDAVRFSAPRITHLGDDVLLEMTRKDGK